MKPNFLIIGAAKCGTTSLYHYLKQHPDVFMPDWKEPSFFAPPSAGGVTTQEEYLSLFQEATNESAVGEASVAYLYAEQAPEQINNLMGTDAKLIILLRNPVDMAYSLWGHQCRQGIENLSFEEALDAEDIRLERCENEKLNGAWIANYAYKNRAHYKEQIERFESVINPDNIRIYLFEEFFASGLPLFDDVCAFLGINDEFKPDDKIYNQGGGLRFKALQGFLNDENKLKAILKKNFPHKLLSFIKNHLTRLNRKQRERAPLSPQTRASLERRFDADVRWLEQRLGRDLTQIWF